MISNSKIITLSDGNFGSIVRCVEDAIRLAYMTLEMGPCVFRGQAKLTISIESSARRRLAKSFDSIVNQNHIVTYHKRLINEARKRSFSQQSIMSMSDLCVIAELQHYGAATMLIDFTYNAFVALFFACDGHFNDDGVVFCYPVCKARYIGSEVEQSSFADLTSLCGQDTCLWKPYIVNSRILTQESVFLFNLSGEIHNDEHDEISIIKIVIPSIFKKNVLNNLSALMNLNRYTLFPDFHGYALANAYNLPAPGAHLYTSPYILNETELIEDSLLMQLIRDAISVEDDNAMSWVSYSGILLRSNDNHEAMKAIDNALAIEGSNPQIVNQIGVEYFKVGRYDSALQYFSLAKEINPEYFPPWVNLAYTHLWNGNVPDALSTLDEESSSDSCVSHANLKYLTYSQILIKNGELDKAVKMLDFIDKEFFPNRYYLTLGHIYCLQRSFNEATECYKKAFHRCTFKNLKLDIIQKELSFLGGELATSQEFHDYTNRLKKMLKLTEYE